MNLPAGLDPGFGLCLVWLLIEVALYTVLHQTGSSDSLRQSVSALTFQRIGPVNDYLTQRIDLWTGPAQGGQASDVIPDYTSLINLKRLVDFAARHEMLYRRRLQFEEIGRLVVVLAMLPPLGTAASLLGGLDRVATGIAALLAFAILNAMVLTALVFAHFIRVRIVSGDT